MKKFDFKNLFVLDLANNHQGNLNHAEKIINDVGVVVKRRNVRAALKFQFRELDTFVHPDHKVGSPSKQIQRFLSTRLEYSDFEKLLTVVRDLGLISICTPFDEASVKAICDLKFDLIKVASCSARDWPLLEDIASSNLPVICSTGGLSLAEIDNVVSFFEHRMVDFALMHCVSIYPTPKDKCNLNQIDVMLKRYPGRVIGWSTHENPALVSPIQIAVAKGAKMFERHVGVETENIKLNDYSSSPDHLDQWFTAYNEALDLCGQRDRVAYAQEKESLDALRRGVYAKKRIKKGQTIHREEVFFALPFQEGQLASGHFKEGMIAAREISGNEPLLISSIKIPPPPQVQVIKDAVHEVKALLNEAHITLSSEFEVEYSHHYGISNFRDHGAVIINCINRDYCKKIVAQLPNQKHPAHYHKLKEETFQILHGILHLTRDGHERTFYPGETCLVMPGVWHSFWTDIGCVFEEISTTHHNTDSIYADQAINSMPRKARKTIVDHWGRYQLKC